MKLRLWAALGAAVVLLSACGSSDSGSASPGSAPTTADSVSESSPSSAEPGSAGDVTCDYPSDGSAPAKEVDPPAAQPTLSGAVPLTITTSVGEINGTLDATAAPCTVNSFAHLAEAGYFDGTTCHRLTTSGIFVLQCGDPTATGMGGPGYSFADELTGSETYPAGTLAMANAGPSTNGSQFFVVYGDTQLSPDYTVFGTIDAAAVTLVEQVAQAGTDGGGGDGAPATPVDISAVTIG